MKLFESLKRGLEEAVSHEKGETELRAETKDNVLVMPQLKSGAIIKKAPITAAYQVNLYCGKCDQIMKFIEPRFDNDKKLLFVYRCECGNEEVSKQQFPHQIVHFDLGRAEVAEVER